MYSDGILVLLLSWFLAIFSKFIFFSITVKKVHSARESLVCDIPAGDGKIANFFYSVSPFFLFPSVIFLDNGTYQIF